MKRRDAGLLLAGAAAVLAAVAAAVVVPEPPPRPVSTAAEQVPVTSTVRGCTTSPGEGDVLAATAAVPGSTGPTPVRDVRPAADLAVVRGTGEDAVGLVAWRTGADATACPVPRTSWWFAGAGGGLDHRTTLVLANVDEGPAVVDVHVTGATGRVDEQALRDLTVAPGSRRVVALADVAPSSDEVAVHVEASQGRVVAQAYDSVRTVRGRSAGVGHAWLPASTPPSTDLRLLGLPARADRRTLLVANTSDRQALVTPQVVTPDGAFVPAGLEEVSVDPGSVAAVPLDRGFDGRLAGLRVRSDVPVLATVRAQVGPDVAYAGALATAAGHLAAPTPGTATLLLQGTDEPTGGEVSAFSASGRKVGAAGLSVPPSGLATWAVPAGAAYVLLRPDAGRGDLVAAVVSGGEGIDVVPLDPVPVAEARPAVRLRTE